MIRRVLCSVLVAIPVLVAFAGPFVAELAPVGRQLPFGPSTWSPFGTDRLGRDVLAAALEGGRTLLVVTVATVLCAYLIGFAVGMLAAAAPRAWLEDLLMRPLDVLLCLPSLLIIVVAAVRTNGSTVAIAAAVGLALIAPIARFVRMAARAVVQGPVMDALRMQGASRRHRYGRYAVRELARPVAADLGVRIAAAIYFLSSANFLGLGFDPTSPDWAVSVAANRDGLTEAPWSVFLPAGLIVLLVVGINLLWDDLLADPRTLAVRDAARAARAARRG
ncbi:ABC transporter permease [Amycolatopsis ultiminotia]|uniref:ABC transporter permease n=1 Tax=Amycolatopsis ultiminotia TaxID=543629 RepID=A0ABP6UXX8_9PSEU